MARGSWFRPHKRNGVANATVPEGLWTKCPGCGEILFARDMERNLKVCPKCDHHHKLRARERLSLTIDEDSFEEFDGQLETADPLEFPNYADKLTRAQAETGLSEGVLTG